MFYTKGYTPEPPLEPPDDDVYITADCGHEVFEGENMYLLDDIRYKYKRWVCPDCFKDELDRMSLEEFADILGVEYQPVERMSG